MKQCRASENSFKPAETVNGEREEIFLTNNEVKVEKTLLEKKIKFQNTLSDKKRGLSCWPE